MSAKSGVVKSRRGRLWTWFFRVVVWGFAALVFASLTSFTVHVELPVRLVTGWYFHAEKTLVPLLGDWRRLAMPLGCLALATWLVHRFIRWWLAAKGMDAGWRLRRTVAVLSLGMLGCAAAITLSGVAHQAVWLAGEPWIGDDRFHRGDYEASAKGGFLLMKLGEFHAKNGRFPESLHEVVAEVENPEKFLWYESRSGVREPFVLLHPGREDLPGADEPVLVSPLIFEGSLFWVTYGNGTSTRLPAAELPGLLSAAGTSKREGSPDE